MSALPRLPAALGMIAACAALSVAAADRRENRPVAGFSAIELSAPLKLELVQGDSESLVLEGDESALADLETVVENGSLHIRTKSRFSAPWHSKVRAFVTAKTIEALGVSGSGDIATQALRSPSLKISIAGSGDIRIASLTSTNLKVSVSGSGDVDVAGKADDVETHISGSGDVKAGKLEARAAKVSIAGSGDATVWAKDSLAVSIAGSGDVRYYGDPAIRKSILGSGSVRRVGTSPS
jgi:Putative auto-transporter adhesin, head GIN domain